MKQKFIPLLLAGMLVLSTPLLWGCSAKEHRDADPSAPSALAIEAADRAAEEIQTLQTMGLLSEQINFTDEPVYRVFPEEADTMDAYYFHRQRGEGYTVQWQTGRYFASVRLDNESGKLSAISITVHADENDVPVREEKDAASSTTYRYYDNYAQLFPETLTVDQFCTLLCEYWGFDGFSLEPTVDSFYQIDVAPPDGETLLKEMDMGENGYLTVLFQGDQEGVPRFVQLADFPDSNVLIAGTGHTNG